MEAEYRNELMPDRRIAVKMYIYLKKDEALKQIVTFKGEDAYIGHFMVYDYLIAPHISLTSDIAVIASSTELKKIFLKATIVAFPKYSTNIYDNRRELGIYKFGKAKAELTPGSNCPYSLRIETSTWEGLNDIETLQERLWAGTITPTVSYEKVQKKRSVYDLLNEVIGYRKLTPIKRWILASRLMIRAKG